MNVYNLLSNALKYHSPERIPLVQVYCRQTDEYLILSVRDNGLGMIYRMIQKSLPCSNACTIMRMEQVLYMVKKIIDNAGGKIEVESQVGKGSTFQVYSNAKVPQ